MIDEAQTLGENLKALGAVMQMVTSRQRQPIAFALAGTPELGQLLLRSGTFPERMPRVELGMLTDEQSRLALLEPANARQVTWDEQSARLIADAAGGYPYFVQLGGYEAWRAEPNEHAISARAGAHAVRAIHEAADRMFRERWERLGPVQRSNLHLGRFFGRRRSARNAAEARPGASAWRRGGGEESLPGGAQPRRRSPHPREALSRRRVRTRVSIW